MKAAFRTEGNLEDGNRIARGLLALMAQLAVNMKQFQEDHPEYFQQHGSYPAEFRADRMEYGQLERLYYEVTAEYPKFPEV